MSRAKTASRRRRVAVKPIVRRHLLLLPAEIRSQIWESVIGGTEPTKDKIELTRPDFIDISSPDFKNHIRFVYTCRQIYNEAHLMFYHRHKLLLPLDNTFASHLKLLRFASNISPKAHRFVGFETCWYLNHIDPTAKQITDGERYSIQTLMLQMASLGWTRRISVLYDRHVFLQAFIEGSSAEHEAWGHHAYEHLVQRYLFRMLLKYVKTQYLRHRTAVVLWVFIVKPNRQNTRQLLAVWMPWFDPINDPVRFVGGHLLAYLHFRLNMPLAPKEWDTKTQGMVNLGVQVMLKILWNMRHWFARQALASLNIFKSMPGTLRDYALAKRRKCERRYKQFQRGLEEKRKREAIHGLDASSTAIFALWPLLLCLALCIGTIIYEYSGPAALLLASGGRILIAKIAMLITYAQQAMLQPRR